MLCRQCTVCRKCLKSSLRTICEEDQELLFVQSNIFVPKGSRCCEEHLYNERLSHDALNNIRPFKVTETMFSSSDVISWFSRFRDRYNSLKYFDFDPPFIMSDMDCNNLTGISKVSFEHLINFFQDSKIKYSSNRSLRNAVGIFLTKLRLGVSNKVLTTIFQFSNPKAVSRTLAAVREAMLSHFVPHYLGFAHISRHDVINNYSSPLATRLLTEQPNTAILVIDGTYLYVQVREYI